MWKDYSKSYIKSNKAASITIMTAVLVSTMFLSLICSLFYNMWQYDIEQIRQEEGDWHGRLVGNISGTDIETIQNFANVIRVESYTDETGQIAADIYFDNMREIYDDLPQIAGQLQIDRMEITYHDTLLSQYFIYDPQDEQPPMLLRFFLFVMLTACVSLVLMIRNAFAASMSARIHQFGILSSIGASPRQIKLCLLQEAFALGILPILFGSALGIGFCTIFLEFAKQIGNGNQSVPIVMHYHPLILFITLLASLLTVFLSAWLPARKICRITPLQAIHIMPEHLLKRKKASVVLSLLFGAEGELAGNALKVRKKELRFSTISLTLSFFAFTMFLIFVSMSNLSTKHSYFEKYKNAWDVIATLRNKDMGKFTELDELANIEGVKSCVAYQKAKAYTVISEEEFSAELIKLGGMEVVSNSAETMIGGGTWAVNVPLVILDDNGFKEYCEQIGIEPRFDGTIVRNRIWDNLNSNFRYPEYIPFLKETMQRITLTDEAGNEIGVELKILAYTEKEPNLREEYEDNSLVQIIPESLWKKIENQLSAAEPDMNIRILASDHSMIYEIEQKVRKRLDSTAEIENRIQKEISEAEMWRGYKMIVGALCALLGFIGITDIFSNTISFLYQRKREFARYVSVGVTPAGIKRMLWIEALAIAGRPVVITAPLAVLFSIFVVNASYLNPKEFLSVLPVFPIITFIFLLFAFVGLAYFIGGRRLLQCDLSEILRNDLTV